MSFKYKVVLPSLRSIGLSVFQHQWIGIWEHLSHLPKSPLKWTGSQPLCCAHSCALQSLLSPPVKPCPPISLFSAHSMDSIPLSSPPSFLIPNSEYVYSFAVCSAYYMAYDLTFFIFPSQNECLKTITCFLLESCSASWTQSILRIYAQSQFPRSRNMTFMVLKVRHIFKLCPWVFCTVYSQKYPSELWMGSAKTWQLL